MIIAILFLVFAVLAFVKVYRDIKVASCTRPGFVVTIAFEPGLHAEPCEQLPHLRIGEALVYCVCIQLTLLEYLQLHMTSVVATFWVTFAVVFFQESGGQGFFGTVCPTLLA